ncbi:MAG: hypothetical protein NW204_02965 [Xanthomonadaceae bacterium]|nr:hypothetical protein [Xanthomonadaceae bacterium]
MLDLESLLVWVSGLSVEAQLALVGTAGAGLLAFGKGIALVLNKVRKPFRVRRITKDNERDIASFVDIYERVIDARSRIDPDEITRWIRGHTQSAGLSHDTFACKHADGMVGFAQVLFCSRNRIAFISYFGVDESSRLTTLNAALSLTGAIRAHIRKRCRGVRYVVFEVDDPSEPGIDSSEFAKRKARIRKFRQLARTCKLSTGELDASYIQPEMPADLKTSNECQMRLLVVGADGKILPTSLPKHEFLELVRFVYYRVYLPSYYKDDEQLMAMCAEYLQDLLFNLGNRTPQRVAVR